MTDRTRSPENRNEYFGPLHRMILDEPMNVWLSACCPCAPRRPDGFYTHDNQITDEGTKQGEDR